MNPWALKTWLACSASLIVSGSSKNRFAGPRPAWEDGGALIVADVIDYGRLKLHVLNTCHSALAYLGLPRGHTFVREAMADPELAQFLEKLVSAEIAPALASLAVPDYWKTVRPRLPIRGSITAFRKLPKMAR